MLVFESTGERTVEVQFTGPGGQPATIALTLAPELLTTNLEAVRRAREYQIWSDEDQAMSGFGVGRLILLLRIKAWQGLTNPAGQDLPCTEVNKLEVFGRYPEILTNLALRLQEQEDAAAKNSGTSQDG